MPAPKTIYTNSKEHCDDFAMLFMNTCLDDKNTPIIAENVALLVGEKKSCKYTGPYCVDSGDRNSEKDMDCSYTRKLCAKCEE